MSQAALSSCHPGLFSSAVLSPYRAVSDTHPYLALDREALESFSNAEGTDTATAEVEGGLPRTLKRIIVQMLQRDIYDPNMRVSVPHIISRGNAISNLSVS